MATTLTMFITFLSTRRPFVVIPRDPGQNGIQRAEMIAEMQDTDAHTRLQQDLMITMWQNWYAKHHEEDDSVDGNDDDAVAENENELDDG